MGNCPKCGGKGWRKTSEIYTDGRRLYKCFRCGQRMPEDEPFIRQSAKVVYIDIETSLTELRNFGLKVQNKWINYKMVRKPFFIICWSAMVVGENKIYSGCVTKEDALAGNDKNILAPLWDLMDSADIIAGHNCNRFDIPKITGRFMINGFSKVDRFKTYDTKLMAKKHGFESNSLDYLSTVFGLKNKEDMKIEDWIAIQETGDEKTLRKMLRYNRGDVRDRGVPILNIFLNWADLPNDYGVRRFPKEPLDLRVSAPNPLRDIQDTLDNIEHNLGA